ncbi:MAG: hypothetical protein IJD18_02060 [Clostridia bacterium]|nr:hypothetical protein [Clostridia bacterium]MBQ3066791.1 hypothetical protein [Clostridia bacterium]
MKKQKQGKQKGYVLAIVMMVMFVISLTMLTTFSIVYRYQNMAKDSAEQTQQKIEGTYQPEEDGVEQQGGDQ